VSCSPRKQGIHSRVQGDNEPDLKYGTTQLQSNIHTRPRHVLHSFWTCPACILDASRIWQKGCSNYINLATVLSRAGMDASRAHSGCILHIPDASCACPRCVLHASCMHFRRISHSFQMQMNVALELSCTVNCASHSWDAHFLHIFLIFILFWSLAKKPTILHKRIIGLPSKLAHMKEI